MATLQTGPDGTVFREERDGPATHVLIVGVGHYPYFQDGGRQANLDAPLGQLTTPPRSARAIASWFIEHYNYPAAPLGSISLLTSEPRSAAFATPQGSWRLRKPSYEAFAAAAGIWFDRGNESERNRLVFLFCGHGYGYGDVCSLLMSDFDFARRDKWDSALELGQFQAAMEECAAAEQVYLIDACRKPHGALLAPRAAGGRTPVQADGVGREAFATRRNAPIFFATGDAQPARGRLDGASVFTEAFLNAVKGMAARNDYGDWRVNNYSLLEAMSYVSERLTSKHFAEPQQPQGGEARRFDFHILESLPVCPVYVGREDECAFGIADLRYQGPEAGTQQCPPGETEMEVRLPLGSYEFDLLANGVSLAAARQESAPSFRIARLR